MASSLLNENKKNSSKKVFRVMHWLGLSPFWAPVEPLAYLNSCLSVNLFPPLLCRFLWGWNLVIYFCLFKKIRF